MFIGVLPQFAAILLLVGLLLAVLRPETIQRIIGAESGFMGMLITSLLGAVTLVPVLIAFPVAAELLKNGAALILCGCHKKSLSAFVLRHLVKFSTMWLSPDILLSQIQEYLQNHFQ